MTPKPKISHLEYNNLMDLLCLDFMKIDPSRTGEENVLVITDAFSKFSVTVVTPNQKALTEAKVLVDKWFHVYGIPACIHSDQGKSFDNNIIKALCKMYESTNHSHVHTIHGSMPSVSALIVPCSVCCEPYQRNKRPIGQFIFQHSSLPTMQHPILQQGFNLTN